MNLCYLVLCTVVVVFERTLTSAAYGYLLPVSPCPEIFSYHLHNDQWYGVMVVKNSGYNASLEVKVTLSMTGKQQTVSQSRIFLYVLINSPRPKHKIQNKNM